MVTALSTVALALLCSASPAITISNVASWSQSGQDVTFDIADGSRLRISILADDLVRLRFAPDGTVSTNISQAVVKHTWPAVAYTAQDLGGVVRLATAELVVDVQKSPCVVSIKDSGGNVILADDPARRIEWGSDYTRVYKTTQPGESYLGLGWRTQPLRRNGTRFVMRNRPTYTDPDMFYGGIPLWYGLRAGKAYAVFFDDASWGVIKPGTDSTSYMSFENAGGQADYYFFYGPEIPKILDRYTELTGRPFMPPKWACGYQQCRWSYTPASDVARVANEFRVRQIPCDVIYLDIDYMNKGKQLTFDPNTFPNPQALCSALHSWGFNVVANIGPWLLENSPKYWEAVSGGYLLQYNGSPQRGWHDYIFFVMGAATGWITWVDFSNSAARSWYADKHDAFLDFGIDGIWNDLNEPDEFGTWPTTVKYSFDGQNVDHNKTSNQYCLLQTDFSYETLRNHYPNRRPFVLSRAAFAGIQRSAAVWSGDNTSDWTNDFKRNIPMGLSMSLSGQPHNGHDIGGFYGYPTFGTKPPAELFARWMEAGVFSAFCRAHHNGEGSRQTYPYCEPWEFGSTTESISRDFISLRYRLMPYLYSLFYQAHTTGAPIRRPTVYDFQDDPATIYQDYDFMFGPFMLVAPVYTPGATSRSVYLPAGTGWTDWWTGAHYAGGQTINVAAPLERLPIFVRDGAIIPMGPKMQYADELPISEITLKLYPGPESTSFTMFEDDGISWDYQTGGLALTTYSLTSMPDSVTLEIGARAGDYVPAPRSCMAQICWRRPAPECVAVNGVGLAQQPTASQLEAAESGWFFDTVTGVLYAKFPDTGDAMTLCAGADVVGPAISSLRAVGVNSAGEIAFQAACADACSGVQRVEFYVDGALAGTVWGEQPSGLYDFAWAPSSAGSHTVAARAYDTLLNTSEAALEITCAGSIADAAQLPEGACAAITDPKPVTAVFAAGDPAMKQRYLYIEEADRSSGIRVRTDDASVSVGDALAIVGTVKAVRLGAKDQLEKYIDATDACGGVSVPGTAPVPGPLAMSNASVGYLTRGLLVRVWGKVTATGICDGYPYIYISDGSPIPESHDLLAPSGSTQTFDGIRVYAALPPGLAVGDFVAITGVAGIECPISFSEVNPVVRVDPSRGVEAVR